VNIIVLGEDQKLYFQQLGAALDVLGYEAPRSVHYSFILLKDGKMSTRKGTVVLLEDFMKEALRRAKQGLEKRGGAMSETTARAIAYGAVKYAVLKVANDRNVIFDWESALNFEGDTGPYLQYSHARINSIFRKYGKDVPDTVDLSLLKEKREYELARELAGFPGIVRRALEELSPNVIANYTYSVAKKFAAFYHEHQVINADTPALTEARLALIGCVRQVLKNGMSLLGIEPVEAM
jgi:arginyl-tRNA synthetase